MILDVPGRSFTETAAQRPAWGAGRPMSRHWGPKQRQAAFGLAVTAIHSKR